MTNYIDLSLVFFSSAVIMVPIFNRLGFGSVLGYLIAGILVGPFGLGLIGQPESVLHFAELGVVLLLFMIGLDIQPKRLWSMRFHLLGLGGLQVLFSTLVFTGILYGIGTPIIPSVILGFGMSLSSTAFAVQTLTEQNEFNTEYGRGSFSILLMQDLLAIPALAIVPTLIKPEHTQTSLGQVSLFLPLFMVTAFFVSRIVFKPLFRLIASSSKEMFTAATLLVVLGVAAIMVKIGLSAAIGTFIAGMLFADSEYRHELEADLNPFKSLLMGLFFIAVGMEVSLDLILDRPLFVIGIAVVYMAIKFAIVYGVARLMKLRHETAKNMATYVSPGGEFAFVIFSTLDGSIVAPELVTLLTAVITLSMAMSPILDRGLEKITILLHREEIAPKYDDIQDEKPVIIIAGLGRFGQIMVRMLRAQKIPFVSIDHDSDQIEYLRKFGHKVYYGDASRVDILESAGAGHAKYLILAIDDIETSLKAVKRVKEHFPQLKIFARARNRGHMFDLLELGVEHVKRETFDSSLNFVGELLSDMGYEQERVDHMLEKFRKHDEIMIREQFKVRTDDKMFVSVSKQGFAQLAQVLEEESQQSYIELPHNDA